jgi:ribonuclease G
MSKDLFISSSPHETKVAVLEDDKLVEVYFEREVDVGLVGGIYKGRVSRVLPGMQSAFVAIGLERDAFLYVSDFYEDEEEYDKVFTEAEARATKFVDEPKVVVAGPAEGENPTADSRPALALAEAMPRDVAPAPEAPPAAATAPPGRPTKEPSEARGHDDPRGRRRRRRGRGPGGPRFASRPEPRDHAPERPDFSQPHTFEVLPGESLAKYRGAGTEAPPLEAGDSVTSETQDMAASEPQDFSGEHESPEAEASTAPTGEGPGTDLEAAGTGSSWAEESVFSPALLHEADAGVEGHEDESPVAPGIMATASPDEQEEVPPPEPTETEEETSETLVGFTLPIEPEKPDKAPASGEPVPPPPSEEAAKDEALTPGPPAADGPAPVAPKVGAEVTEIASATSPASEEAAAAGPVAELPPETVSETASEAPTPTVENPVQSTEQKYTLREPHQRPRFDPRRRRGRRGGGRHPRTGGQDSNRPGNHTPVQIADVLKEGQEIIVQIAKEPLGTKGARITSHIALPGRYLVYMPTISHIGVSRKIASEEERLRLRNIILENRGSLTGGFIVRTAGGGRPEEEFKADLKFLSALWGEIRSKAERSKAPVLLHRDLELVQRILRDILSPDFKQVRVDNETDYERVVEFVNRCQPSLVGHVKLYSRKTPIFEEFGIQPEIDKALKPKVWLKSGGYIVVNQTEALVAIDVNTGKYVGKTNRLEDTIVKTNVDAVNEIVRQLRLRDLGGIIVIDFIDMDERQNRNKVVQALEEALRRDRAPTKILSINEFGLVALTRKRVKQSLERTLCEPCSYCTGSGWVKSANTVCNEILAEAKKMAGEIEGDVMTLRVNPVVGHALRSRQGALISEIESLTHKDVIIKGDETVHQERFEIY